MFKNLSLKNVKSFQQVDIALSPLTLVLGTNAAGKSNLRDAFRFLHGLSRGYKFVDLFAGKYEGGEQVWSGIRGGPYEFIHNGAEHFGIEIVSAEPKFTYHILIGKGGIDPFRRIGEALYTNEAVYDIGRSYKEKFFTMGVASMPNDEAALTLYARFPEEKFSIKKKEHLQTAIECFANMRFLDLVPEAMREATYLGQNILGDRGENLSTVLYDLIHVQERGYELVEWLRALTPMDVAEIKFEKDGRGRHSLSIVEHNRRETSVYSASDGTLRFLAYIAFLFSASKPTFCFVEELENGIHPSRLSLLVELLETQAKRRNVQFVATTHSPALLNLVSEETLAQTLIAYRTEGAGFSQIRPLSRLHNFEAIVKRRKPGTLMETGWLENTLEAMAFDAESVSTVEERPL